MTEVDLAAVKKAVVAAVRKAADAGALEEVTFGQTRDNVEKELGLEPGILKTAEYKAAVKEIIAAATDEIEQEEEAEEAAPPTPVKAKSKGPKRKSAESQPKPIAKPRATKGKADGKGKKGAKPKRSPSMVPSTDDEEVHSDKGDSWPGPSKPASVKEPPPKRRKVLSEDDEKPGAADHVEATASTSSAVVVSSETKGKTVEDAGEKSESEMSIVLDEPPKRRGTKKSDDSKPTKGRKKKAPAEELSKDDQQIKRLKSFVVACGVRKVWAKEFKDLESKASQIRRLKEMLADLGMKGRMSLEQAKAIKEKREFEQELEDVKQFEKAIVSGPRQTRGGRLASKQGASNDDSDEESDVPVKPKHSARNQIMAFLGDQSDSE